MVRRVDPSPTDHDERLGEAIEAYLALVEQGHPPDPEEFAARYPDLREDLASALEGLSLVRGLVGDPNGPGHRLESGHRIAGYRIVRELGRGGMGIVYEAVHVGLDRPVALKVLGSHAAPDSNGRRRFLNEARTAAGLHHTHIVPVFDVGQVGGLCYYAMQRIEGSGLDRVIRHLRRDRVTAAGSSTGSTTPRSGFAPTKVAQGLDETASWGSRVGQVPALGQTRMEREDEPPPFEPPRGSAYYRWVAQVGRQAAEALNHAHHRGVIHRDVKPSNLLVDARGTVWMGDFGLARRLADPSLTQHDSLLGTPRYMSPEQARVGPIDGRTDVYSLGATLYELLTLRPPFEGRTAAELVEQIRTRDPVPPRQFDARIPRDVETIILKALAKRPNDRYASASELADDLGRYLNREPVRARRIGPIGRLWRVAQRHPGMSVVSTAAALTVAVVVTIAYVRVLDERDQTRAALRDQYLHRASAVRFSNVPNRRATGLNLLAKASELAPDSDLRVKLRDEAIEFLILRDVEARTEFATGRTRGIAFGPDGVRLAALSDDGDRFSLWDVETRQRLEEQRLRVAGTRNAYPRRGAGGRGPGTPGGRGPGTPGGRGPGTPGGRGSGGAGGRWLSGPAVAAVGRHIAAVLPDGQGFRLFDAQTGMPIRDTRTPGRQVLGLFAPHNGSRLVTIDATPLGPDNILLWDYRVNLWDLETPGAAGKPLEELERWQAELRDFPLVAFAPDGKVLAIARARGKTVSLRSPEDGESLGLIDTQVEMTALAVGPHGQLAVAGGGTVRFWDVDSLTPLPSISPSQNFVRMMRFSPNGTLLVVVGPGAELELWDTAAYSLVAVLPTPDRISDVAFSPDGRTLAAGELGESAVTSVWAIIDPVARLRLSGFETPPTALTFRGDGLMALGTSGGSIRFWRPGRCLSASHPVTEKVDEGDGDIGAPVHDRPTGLAFDDAGELVAIEPQSLTRTAEPGKVSNAQPLPLPKLEAGRPFFTPIARTADGKTLVIARGHQLLLWHSSEPDRIRQLEPPSAEPHGRDHPGRFSYWRSVAISPAGDRLYLISSVGAILAWSLDGDRAVRQEWVLSGASIASALGKGTAFSLSLSPDGSSLAVGGGRSRGIALIDAARGTVRTQLRLPDGETEILAVSVAFSPLGGELAVGTQQGHVFLWSLDHLSAPVTRLPGLRGSVNLLAYDATGHYLALGGSAKLVDVWDVKRIRVELARLELGW